MIDCHPNERPFLQFFQFSEHKTAAWEMPEIYSFATAEMLKIGVQKRHHLVRLFASRSVAYVYVDGKIATSACGATASGCKSLRGFPALISCLFFPQLDTQEKEVIYAPCCGGGNAQLNSVFDRLLL